MSTVKEGLQYVKNTNGGATMHNFWENFEPVGILLWNDLFGRGYVRFDGSAKIFLTPNGEEALTKL